MKNLIITRWEAIMSDDMNNNGPWGSGPSNNNPSGPKNNNEDIEKLIRESRKKIKSLIPNGNEPEKKKIIMLVIAVIAILWLASGIYVVDTKEQGVVLRFGKYVRTEQSGLQYRLPFPIEKVIKLRTTDRYTVDVGYRTQISNRSLNSDSSREILMLTGDENIVNINFEVQYQITDPRKFLFNVYNPSYNMDKTIKAAAESAMREVVGTTPISAILAEGRSKVQQDTKVALQEILDSYDAGIRIEAINMRGIPPSVVQDAFKDVQAAKINKQEIINKSIAYQNEVIPKARGDAQKLIEQAEAYKNEVIAKSEGEAQRFISIYNKYRLAKNVTRKRIYLETMEEILNGADKVILDNKSGNSVLPYLPLKELGKR